MAKQNINIGTIVNDGAGDSLRDGAIKINSNFTEIYNSLGNGSAIQLSVDLTVAPAAGQVLQFNSVTGKFVAGNAGAKGDKGDTGDTGAKGDKGDKGDTGDTGDQGEQGVPGPRLTVQGSVQSSLDLPSSNNELGDILVVEDTDDAYVWVRSGFGDSSFEWQNIGPLVGPQGIQGETGPRGLQGIQGTQGPTGASGPPGPIGPPGNLAGPFFGSLFGSVVGDDCTLIVNATTSAVTGSTVNVSQLLNLPTYTTAQTSSIVGSEDGSIIYVSDGDAGQPCLAVRSSSNWLRIALGTPIST
jgi:hypothetical protein